jgi:hypothetical protein
MISDGNTQEVFHRARLSIGIALIAFAAVMAAGTVGYKHLGGAETGWTDALYMTFLMVATIGYGAGVEIWHRPEVADLHHGDRFLGHRRDDLFLFKRDGHWFWPAISTSRCGDGGWTR